VLLIKKIIQHDHHQSDDKPQGKVFIKRIQKYVPPVYRFLTLNTDLDPALIIKTKSQYYNLSEN
jgi:hypothetical protein